MTDQMAHYIKFGKLDPNDLGSAITHKDPIVRSAVATTPGHNRSHVDTLLSDPDPMVKLSTIKSPHFTQDDANTLSQIKDRFVREKLSKTKWFTPQMHQSFMNSENPYDVRTAIKSKYTNEEMLDKLITHQSPIVRESVINSPLSKDRHYSGGVADTDRNVAMAALNRTKNVKDMERALLHPDEVVRAVAVGHSTFNPREHAKLVSRDKSQMVKDVLNHRRLQGLVKNLISIRDLIKAITE